MRRARFPEEPMIYAIRQAESEPRLAPSAGSSASARPPSTHLEQEVCASGRERVPRFRPVAEENVRLKRLVADLSLDNHRLSEALEKKSLRPVRRRNLAHWFHETCQISGLRACQLALFGRASWYRRSPAKDHTALRLRNCELAHAQPRLATCGFEGWLVNRKCARRG